MNVAGRPAVRYRPPGGGTVHRRSTHAAPTATTPHSLLPRAEAADEVAQVDLGVVVAHFHRVAVEVARARTPGALAVERVHGAAARILEVRAS